MVARHWSSAYEWAIHAGEAARAGLAEAAIADARRRPAAASSTAPPKQVVFDVATELVATAPAWPMRRSRAPRRRSAGQALVELVGLVGYYTMVAMTLNAFEVPVPDGRAAAAAGCRR